MALGTAAAVMAAAPAAQAGTIRTTFAQRVKAATIATSKAGAWYQWGATGPRQFDCSGLVVYAYRTARRPLAGRTTWDLWRNGVRIPRSKLQKGDLVWTWSRSMGHMGIYVGGNRYVHAPGAGRRVMVAPLPSGGGYIGAVRP